MSKLKVDFALQAEPPYQAALNALKVGDLLELKQTDEQQLELPMCCYVSGSDTAVGVVPPTIQARLPLLTQLAATVRSLRRDACTGTVAQVQLRVELTEAGEPIPGADTAKKHGNEASALEAQEATDFEHQLRRSQLERLVACKELIVALKDQRLQHLLLQIDSAPDREKAIDNALNHPGFRQFADKVLDVTGQESS